MSSNYATTQALFARPLFAAMGAITALAICRDRVDRGAFAHAGLREDRRHIQPRDVERFQDYVRLFGGGRVLNDGWMEAPGGRRFRAGAYPISIDTDTIATQARAAVTKTAVRETRQVQDTVRREEFDIEDTSPAKR